MNTGDIIKKLDDNLKVISDLLLVEDGEIIFWRPNPNHWCLLEIICHLVDEESKDFRNRVLHLLEHPGVPPSSFDPSIWVIENKYLEQDYKTKIEEFVQERKNSISILSSLKNPKWENGYDHSKLGKLSAMFYLNNWLAHDYLHIRQITKVKYLFLLNSDSNINYDYAGTWVK